MTRHESWTILASEELDRIPESILDGRTMIETPVGPVAAESLSAGDTVMTFDDGPMRLRSATRRSHGEIGRMVLVPQGLIGNEADMLLAPTQHVIVESDVAEALTGSPFAVIEASSLEMLEGVRRTRAARVRNLVTLAFASTQAVMAAGGAVLVTEPAMGLPCLLQEEAGRYASLPHEHVQAVVEALDETTWDIRYAAIA